MLSLKNSAFGLLLLFAIPHIGHSEDATESGPQLTIDAAIQQALAKNFTLRIERFDPDIGAARLTEAFGKFDLVLSGSYSSSENFQPQLVNELTLLRPTARFAQADEYELNLEGVLPWGMTYGVGANSANRRNSGGIATDNFATFAGVYGTQPLLKNFGFNPTLASIRIARTNLNISEAQYRQVLIDTITSVIFAYHDLNNAHANYRSAVRSRDLAAQLLEENKKRFSVGSIAEYEITAAASRMASREESVLFAARSIRVAENSLKLLITDEKTPALLSQRINIEPPAPAAAVTVNPSADFATALEKRPDYQQARLALKRSDLNTRLQRNQLLPRVDLVGSYGYNGYDRTNSISRQQIRDQDYHAYSAGVVVSMPVTFSAERGRYRAAKFQQRQIETELERLEQEIVIRVGNAASQVETVQQRILATRRARELAQATLDAEVKQLRAGQSSTFFVAQQQEIVSQAEVREAAAQSDYHKALAEYDRQLGRTLEKHRVHLAP